MRTDFYGETVQFTFEELRQYANALANGARFDIVLEPDGTNTIKFERNGAYNATAIDAIDAMPDEPEPVVELLNQLLSVREHQLHTTCADYLIRRILFVCKPQQQDAVYLQFTRNNMLPELIDALQLPFREALQLYNAFTHRTQR